MLTFLIFSLSAATVLAMAGNQTGKKATSPDPKNMELMKPGLEHEQIMKMAGNWNASCKFWMDADEQAVEATGTLNAKVILDGRYLEGEFKATIKGQPFAGRSLNGFNRVSKQFQYVWYDSMGTGITSLQGPAGADGKTVTYTGAMECAMKGHVTLRFVEACQSDDQLTHVMYQTKDGIEKKTMEITYNRRK